MPTYKIVTKSGETFVEAENLNVNNDGIAVLSKGIDFAGNYVVTAVVPVVEGTLILETSSVTKEPN